MSVAALDSNTPVRITPSSTGSVKEREKTGSQFASSEKTVTTSVVPAFAADLFGIKTKTITLKNTGGTALAGTGNAIQVSPTGETGDWEDLDATAFDALASNAIKSLTFETAHRFWRILANTGAGTTTVKAWIDGNIG